MACCGLDLFGDPLPGAAKRGRPRHRPSQLLRDRVTELASEGLNQEQIAAAIGITKPTLVRNYHRELGSQSTLWRQRQRADQERDADRSDQSNMNRR